MPAPGTSGKFARSVVQAVADRPGVSTPELIEQFGFRGDEGRQHRLRSTLQFLRGEGRIRSRGKRVVRTKTAVWGNTRTVNVWELGEAVPAPASIRLPTRRKQCAGVLAGTEADARTGDVDRPEPAAAPVLYDLLTPTDVRELNRRRAMRGLPAHRIATHVSPAVLALVAWGRGRHHRRAE